MKENIFQRLYGTYETCDLDPRMLHQMATANRGTQVFRRQHQNLREDNQKILDRLFWVFPETIYAFHHYHPVLLIDGTFLTEKYKGIILAAIIAKKKNSSCLLPIH
jgi:hypothetical protein